MLWRIWLWLRGVWRRRVVRVVSIPVPGECDHHHDPEAVMHRLVASVTDPQRFAQVLAESANCRGCQAAIIATFAYELAGFVLVDQATDDVSAEQYGCGHTSFNPEMIAMRLTLANKSGDTAVTAATLAEADECPDCLASVILSLVNAHVAVLDTTRVSWEPLVQRQLLSLLDSRNK
jgi:hypothetical protein